jgi:hypothetical protein
MVYKQNKLRKLIPLSKLNWSQLSANKNAIELLKANPKKIDWENLSNNPNAIELLKTNLKKVDWSYLSDNPNAMEILEENQNNIYWYMISSNSSIFTYDYELIRKNFKNLGEEIIQKALRPDRMFRLMNEYGADEIYKCYF